MLNHQISGFYINKGSHTQIESSIDKSALVLDLHRCTVGCGLFCKIWDIKDHNWPHLDFGQKGPKNWKLTKNSPIWSGAELSNFGHGTNKVEKSNLR